MKINPTIIIFALIFIAGSRLSRAQVNVLTKKDFSSVPFALLDGESVSLYADYAIARKADPNRSSMNTGNIRKSAEDMMTELWSAERNFRGNIPWTSAMIVDRLLKPYRREDQERYDNNLLHVVARAYADQGIMNHHMGLLDKAEKATIRSREMREQRFGVDHITTISSINNLGALYRDMGKYVEAKQLFEEAKEGLVRIGMFTSMETAVVLNNQSMLFLSLGQNKEAEDAIYTAIAVADKFSRDKSKDFLPFLVNKALVMWAKDDLNEAEKILTEVKEIKEKRFGKKKTQYARALNHLAAVKMKNGKMDGVNVLLEDAYTIYLKTFGENHPTTANISGNMGRYFMLSEQYSKARPQLEKAKKSQSYILNKYHPDYILTLEALAITFWKSGNIDSAKTEFDLVTGSILEQIANYFPAMSEQEQSKFWDKSKPLLMSYYQFIAENLDKHPAWSKGLYEMHLATKGLLLTSNIGVRRDILSTGNPSLIDSYDEWIQLKSNMASYYSMPKKQLYSLGINLLSMEKKAASLEDELSKGSYKFASIYSKATLDIDAIKSKLGSKEALLEVIRIINDNDEAEYLILIFSPSDNYPKFIRLKNGSELESKYLKYHRSSIRFQTEDEYSYAKYWAPFESKLAGVDKIYMSLDGVYNQLSMLSLKPLNGEYLIDQFQIEFVSSGRQLLESEKITAVGKSVLVGDPVFTHKSISALPSTKVEVESIQQLMQQKSLESLLLMQNDASEISLNNVQNPPVLHIATHGFFLEDAAQNSKSDFGFEVLKVAENPLHRSGLMLSGSSDSKDQANNGILTAHEVMSLQLENTNLVVLSACETGLGEIKVGEGVYGLQRAEKRLTGSLLLGIICSAKIKSACCKRNIKINYQNTIGVLTLQNSKYCTRT